jgi:L-lactate dehydrogenase complex protein LldG
MSARDAIFSAIRFARPDGSPAETIAAQAAECAAMMRKTLPALDDGDLAQLFTDRASAEKVGATVERVAGLAEFPQAVARYIAANDLAPVFALQPDPRLQHLDWGALQPNEVLRPDTALAVGMALCGVAETGSLVFHSGPTAPTLYGFLPLHHLVALDAQSLMLRLDDYAVRESGKPSPRNVNFITGASGTTDIEGVLARGAHGPRKLHIVIYG